MPERTDNPLKLKQRNSSPKFQIHNTALMSALHPQDFQEVRKDLPTWGRWVESAVGTHLVNHGLSHGYKVYYWRHVNNEVDFVLEYKGLAVGIEVKSGPTKMTAGFQYFMDKFKPHKMLMVGKGGIPWEDFLKSNPRNLF